MRDNRPVILVVDDNPRNLKLIGTLLKEWDYRPVLATSARECLLYIEKKCPDLILMDVLMPDMNGFEACRTIRETKENQRIPILFLTALSDKDNIVEGFGVGGVDYITKPFIHQEVRARIEVHLKLKRTVEMLERMSLTDELTGTFNRRHAFAILSREMKTADRLHLKLVICYIDIDNLKQVNDNLGHESGDELIKGFVRHIQSGIRETDYLFRMGGDEFMLILPNTCHENSEQLLGRLASDHILENSIPVEFSYGLTVYDPTKGVDPESLIKEADARMYEQKKQKKEMLFNSTP